MNLALFRRRIVLVIILLVIVSALYIKFVGVSRIPRYGTFWLASLVALITIAAMFNVHIARRLSYLSRRLFSVAKFVGICALLVALLGVVIRLSSTNEGVTILAFDDDTKDTKYNGKAIADSLQVELLRIQNILVHPRKNIGETERLKSMSFRQDEKLSDSLKDIGTIGAGEAKISLGAVLLACKRFWPIGDAGTVISGGVQHFGQSVRIVARVEWKSEIHGYQVTRVPKTEDEIFDMVHELAFKIAMGLQDPSYPITAKTSEGLQRFTEALDYYDHFIARGEMADLNSAKQSCFDAFDCEIGYVKLFDLLTNIGISYADVKDYQSATEAFEKAVLLQPNNAIALTNVGLTLARLQRTEESREAFRKAKLLSGDSPEVQAAYATNLGDAQFYANHLVDAETSYSNAIEAKPDSAPAHLGLARVLLSEGQSESAKREFIRAIELDPKSTEPHIRLGDLFLTVGDYESARSKYMDAIAIDSENAEAFDGLGNIFLVLGDMDSAIPAFQLSIDLASNFSSPHVGLGRALRIKGDIQGAMREYKRATELDPLDQEPHSALGEFFLQRGELDKAASEFRRAIELAPESETAHLNLGDLLLAQRKLEEARHEYSVAQKISPQSRVVLMSFGDLCMEKHDYDSAEKEYTKAKDAAPEDPWPYLKLGDLHRAKGEIDASKDAYISATTLAPQMANPHCGLARTWYNAGDYKSATEECSLAIQEAPGWSDPYVVRGDRYYATADFESAATEYSRAIEMSPLSAEAHASLADVYSRNREYDKAVEEYSTAIKSDSGNFYPEAQLGAVLLIMGKLQDAVAHCERGRALGPKEYVSGLLMGTIALLKNQPKKADQIWGDILAAGDCRGIDDKLDRVLILFLLHKDKDAFELFKEISSLPVRPTGLLLERKDLLNSPLLNKSDRFMRCRQLLADVDINTAKSAAGKEVGKTGDKTKRVPSMLAPLPR
jgi:tetratricopeptide (TPR) repeat protein